MKRTFIVKGNKVEWDFAKHSRGYSEVREKIYALIAERYEDHRVKREISGEIRAVEIAIAEGYIPADQVEKTLDKLSSRIQSFLDKFINSEKKGDALK